MEERAERGALQLVAEAWRGRRAARELSAEAGQTATSDQDRALAWVMEAVAVVIRDPGVAFMALSLPSS
jgi:hypothetical protein